jgi:hypothetical protein
MIGVKNIAEKKWRGNRESRSVPRAVDACEETWAREAGWRFGQVKFLEKISFIGQTGARRLPVKRVLFGR